jgi:predicted flap endonuclease-1-like 5' DNA nuclease
MAKITDIEGVGPAIAEKLSSVGITSVDGLLKACGSAKGRKEVAAKTGLSEKDLLEWTNHADLFRIKGIGSEYADLLEASGVDTCPELAKRKADNLTKKMEEINAEKKLVRRTPPESVVEDWINQAKKLPKIVTH